MSTTKSLLRNVFILAAFLLVAPTLAASPSQGAMDSHCVHLDEHGIPCTLCINTETGCYGYACDNPDGGYDTGGGCSPD